MPKAAMAGTSSGMQHHEEDLHVTGAVHPGSLDDRRRDLLHEVVQQEDRQRQAEDRVRDPHRPERVLQAEVDEDRLQRDQGDLDRHDLQREDRDEQEIAALEVDPGEAYAASSARLIGMITAGKHDDERVQEESRRGRPPSCRPGVGVVLEGDTRVGEERPPAGGRDVGRRPERGDEQAERRNRPQDGEDDRDARTPRARTASSWRPAAAAVSSAAVTVSFSSGVASVVIGSSTGRTGHAHRISSESRICRTL